MQKTLLPIFIFVFLAKCDGKTMNFGANNNLNFDTRPIEDLISESNNLKVLLLPFPKFINISDAFHTIEKFSKESLMGSWAVHNAFQDLWITSNSILNAHYMMIDPEQHDESIEEKIEKFDRVLSDFKYFYFRIREESWKIPFSQLFQGIKKNESLEAGIYNQTELLEGCEKFLDMIRNFKDFIEPLINKLELKKIIIQNSFSRASYRNIRKAVLSSADILLLKVANKSQDYCQTLSDCLQEIYVEFFQNKEFDSTLTKPMLLSILFEELTNVSAILVGENEDRTHQVLQRAQYVLKQTELTRKEVSWPLSIVRDWVVEKVFGLDENILKQNLEKEAKNIRVIFHLVQQDLKEKYERFIWNIWQDNQKEFIEMFSKEPFSL